jgi:predicted RNA binding protein YcfA (HicA-like mRNA interferase family)
MSKKLPLISGKDTVKAFSRGGWRVDRIAGSHAVMRKDGSAVTLSVPLHKEPKKRAFALFDKRRRYRYRRIPDLLSCSGIIGEF